jgi:hypothetical protein
LRLFVEVFVDEFEDDLDYLDDLPILCGSAL